MKKSIAAPPPFPNPHRASSTYFGFRPDPRANAKEPWQERRLLYLQSAGRFDQIAREREQGTL
jgi:hypothetical protein